MKILSNNNSISFRLITSWSILKPNLILEAFKLLNSLTSASMTEPSTKYFNWFGFFWSKIISIEDFTFPFLICFNIKFLVILNSYSLIKLTNWSILFSFVSIDIWEIAFSFFRYSKIFKSKFIFSKSIFLSLIDIVGSIAITSNSKFDTFNLKFISFKFNLIYLFISFTFLFIKLLNLFVLIPTLAKSITIPRIIVTNNDEVIINILRI